jgi:hypothetical protein
MNNIFRNAVVVTVVLAAVSLLSRNVGNAQGTVFTSTAPIRGYYLTKSTITGSKVLTACASGYHFASIWEILNTSDLHYNTTLGRTNVNSGSGPPALTANGTDADNPFGWIRSGGRDDPNCINWTSSNRVDGGSEGTLALSPPQWAIDVGGGTATPVSCDATFNGKPVAIGVLCVQN